MKVKFLALSVAVFIITNIANAQKLPINLGIKVGANLTKVDGQSFKDGFKVSYLVGAYADLNVARKIAIQPELLFRGVSGSTATNNIPVPNVDAVRNFTLHYLDIPIAFDYKVLPFVHAQVGPQFSALLNKNESLSANGAKAFKSGDFSVFLGAEVRLLKFRAGLRYVIGLTNINDISSQDKWKNQNLQLHVGYNIF